MPGCSKCPTIGFPANLSDSIYVPTIPKVNGTPELVTGYLWNLSPENQGYCDGSGGIEFKWVPVGMSSAHLSLAPKLNPAVGSSNPAQALDSNNNALIEPCDCLPAEMFWAPNGSDVGLEGGTGAILLEAIVDGGISCGGSGPVDAETPPPDIITDCFTVPGEGGAIHHLANADTIAMGFIIPNSSGKSVTLEVIVAAHDLLDCPKEKVRIQTRLGKATSFRFGQPASMDGFYAGPMTETISQKLPRADVERDPSRFTLAPRSFQQGTLLIEGVKAINPKLRRLHVRYRLLEAGGEAVTGGHAFGGFSFALPKRTMPTK
jgi:hypothetical protein